MRFTETLKASVTPEWKHQYLHYPKLRRIIEEAQRSVATSPDKLPPSSLLLKYEEDFFKLAETELQKINSFFSLRLEEAVRRWNELRLEIGSLCLVIQEGLVVHDRAASEQDVLSPQTLREALISRNSFFSSSFLDFEVIQRKRKKNDQVKNAFKALRLAVSEFYLYLSHVKNYQVLNFTGFRKIFKKFDKVFKSRKGESFRIEHVEGTSFHTCGHIADLTTDVENVFIKIFADGNRSRGMNRLRVPLSNDDKRGIELPSFLVGLFFGAVVVLATVVVLVSVLLGWPDRGLNPIIIFSGQFMLICYAIGFASNLYGWSRCNINHILIFEIDPRRHLNFRQCLWFGLCSLTVWLSCIIGYIFSDRLRVSHMIFPFVSSCTLALFILMPFNILYASGRKWFLKVTVRNFIAPFHSVAFADFWLYDQYCSMSGPLVDVLSVTPCIYITELMESVPNGLCVAPIQLFSHLVRIWPFYVRFAQCLRRFRDFKAGGIVDNIHIFNAIKYLSSIVAILLFIWHTVHRSAMSRWVSLGFRFCSVSYLIFWDLWIDWGFFGSTDQLRKFKTGWRLRPNTVYPHRSVYYIALVQNVIVRYTALLPQIFEVTLAKETLEYFIYLTLGLNTLEIIRRCVWNFFRLENEHLNNVGKFRAVRDIKLPYFEAPVTYRTLVEERLLDGDTIKPNDELPAPQQS